MFRKSKRMHFIGIGGIGMSGIAEILINLGYEVSGSDLRSSEQTRRLEGMGATVYTGHAPSNIKDYHVVITSSAIDLTNPEIIEARKRRIPIIHRSEMLAEHAREGGRAHWAAPTSGQRGQPWKAVAALMERPH